MTIPAIILGLLDIPFLYASIMSRVTKANRSDRQLAGCIGVCLVFFFAGIGHFIKTEEMATMLPPWVPGRITLVYVTGEIEIVAGVTVLIPRLRLLTAWGLVLMLMLFLPVNFYTAVNHIGMGGHQWGPAYLLIRVPLQAILVTWIWWFAVRNGNPK
jgi:uncharacterized membrane protein